VTGDVRCRTAAEHAVQVIAMSARPVADGVAWSESADIISGGSGIALSLLWAAKTLEADRRIGLAKRAGIRRAALGKPEHGGLQGAVAPDFPNLYPNFSHGTAGVSYTLVTQTGFLQGAAGVGTFLLHLDAQAQGRASRIVLPDSPFA